MNEFEKPESMREALERELALRMEIDDIELQLGVRSRFDSDGKEKQSPYEYKGWRNKARVSLTRKKQERAHLNRWIKNRRFEIEAMRCGTDDPHSSYAVMMTVQEKLDTVLSILGEDRPDMDKVETLARSGYSLINLHLQHSA